MDFPVFGIYSCGAKDFPVLGVYSCALALLAMSSAQLLLRHLLVTAALLFLGQQLLHLTLSTCLLVRALCGVSCAFPRKGVPAPSPNS